MDAIAGIDFPAPRVKGVLHVHADWLQHHQQWHSDLKLMREMGMNVLRYGLEWEFVHVAPAVFHWHLLDERIDYARRLGFKLQFVGQHFNTPRWLAEDGKHQIWNPLLGDWLGDYLCRVHERYRPELVIPMVEPATYAWMSAGGGHWECHETGKAQDLKEKLYDDFIDAAFALHRAGARVGIVECAHETKLVGSVRFAVDEFGLDYYPAGNPNLLLYYLKEWHKLAVKKPVFVSEYDICGTEAQRRHHIQHELTDIIEEAFDYGFGPSGFCWYPTIENFWHSSLCTPPAPGYTGDNAGLCRLEYDGGMLKRIPLDSCIQALQRMHTVAAEAAA